MTVLDPPLYRVGDEVTVTTTSRPIPPQLRTTTPHQVEGTVAAVLDDALVLRVIGWSAWLIPLEAIVSVELGGGS